MATTYTMDILQGATYQLIVTYQDSNGDPIDITGYSARMSFRYTSKSGVCALELTEGSGLTIDPLLGKITIDITPTQTTELTSTMYYNLEIYTVGDADVIRVLHGTATVNLEVSECD